MTNASVTCTVTSASSGAIAPERLYVGLNLDFVPYRPPTSPTLGWRIPEGPAVALAGAVATASAAAVAPKLNFVAFVDDPCVASALVVNPAVDVVNGPQLPAPAEATGIGVGPALSGTYSINEVPVPAEASAAVPIPVQVFAQDVPAVTASALAIGPTLLVTFVAVADAAAVNPVAETSQPFALAEAAAIAPTTSASATVTAPVATGSSAAVAPKPGVSVVFSAGSVIEDVGTESGDSFDVIFAADGSKAYITNVTSKTITVITAATNSIASTISIGGQSLLQGSANGSKLYVAANYQDGALSYGAVRVISTSTDVLTTTISLGTDKVPQDVVFSPDGATAYAINRPNTGSGGTISVIDAATDTVSDTITGLPDTVRGATMSPNGAKLYVADFGTTGSNGTVKVVDLATESVSSISVGGFPEQLEITPDGTKLYVPLGNGTVSVVNTATNTVATTISVDSYPYGVAISADGAKAYVTNFSSNTVSIITTASDTVTGNISVSGGPGIIAISPLGTKAFIANADNTATILT